MLINSNETFILENKILFVTSDGLKYMYIILPHFLTIQRHWRQTKTEKYRITYIHTRARTQTQPLIKPKQYAVSKPKQVL